jgi:hypothetical protein
MTLAVAVLAPLLSACSVPTLTQATIALKPTLVLNQKVWHRGWNAFPTCSYTGGLSQFAAPTGGAVPLGYARSYDDRFCWEQYGEAHRVLLQFDVSELSKLKSKVIVSADLQIDERIIVMRASDGDGIRTTGSPSCLGRWYLPDADPRTGNPWAADGEYRFERKLDGPFYRITGLVSSWVTGSAPNTGILLRGEDENLKAEDNAACVSALSGFRLIVWYRASSIIGS